MRRTRYAAEPMTPPVLYSFRRCPYAIRARLALARAGVPVELREVRLRDKPDAMLRASSKGTVPVLHLRDGRVIDESLEVMHWALAQSPGSPWAPPTPVEAQWIEMNDGDFKIYLDRYKYADRYPEHPPAWYRGQMTKHLTALDGHLARTPFLAGDAAGFVDAALLPFIRQFSMVDSDWFASAPYPALRRWLRHGLDSALFQAVMFKAAQWHPGQPPLIVDWSAAAELSVSAGAL